MCENSLLPLGEGLGMRAYEMDKTFDLRETSSCYELVSRKRIEQFGFVA